MKRYRIILFLVLASFLSGCAASVMSEGVLMDVDRNVKLPMVQSDPDAYKERRVLWGGIIVSTKNFPDHTRIEVLAKELAYMDMPKSYDQKSEGRFIILAPGYYDKLDYKAGVGITVVGSVKGTEKIKIGEMEYLYVLIAPIEMQTFDPDDNLYNYDYPYTRDYPYYGPYGPYPSYPPPYPYDPFLNPYYGPYFPGMPGFFYPGGYGPKYYPGHHHHD